MKTERSLHFRPSGTDTTRIIRRGGQTLQHKLTKPDLRHIHTIPNMSFNSRVLKHFEPVKTCIFVTYHLPGTT